MLAARCRFHRQLWLRQRVPLDGNHCLPHVLVQRLLVEHRPLRRAYQHELADIISIVKHAAVGGPLLSAEERVRAGRTFTPGQERWLELIRNHLVENLAVDRKDLRLHPRRRYLGPREPRF